MPIYAYECRECGVRFERRQSFSDAPISVCPECEGEVHRLIQPAGIIFKGSGFYVTDNRGDKSALTGTKSDSKTEASAAKASEKTDSTPASKAGDD